MLEEWTTMGVIMLLRHCWHNASFVFTFASCKLPFSSNYGSMHRNASYISELHLIRGLRKDRVYWREVRVWGMPKSEGLSPERPSTWGPSRFNPGVIFTNPLALSPNVLAFCGKRCHSISPTKLLSTKLEVTPNLVYAVCSLSFASKYTGTKVANKMMVKLTPGRLRPRRLRPRRPSSK